MTHIWFCAMLRDCLISKESLLIHGVYKIHVVIGFVCVLCKGNLGWSLWVPFLARSGGLDKNGAFSNSECEGFYYCFPPTNPFACRRWESFSFPPGVTLGSNPEEPIWRRRARVLQERGSVSSPRCSHPDESPHASRGPGAAEERRRVPVLAAPAGLMKREMNHACWHFSSYQYLLFICPLWKEHIGECRNIFQSALMALVLRRLELLVIFLVGWGVICCWDIS